MKMYIQMIRALYLDELGPDLFGELVSSNIIARYHLYKLAETGKSAWCDDVTTPGKTESFDDDIRTAFTAAIDSISAQLGDNVDTWKWGDVHTLTIKHPMGDVEIVAKLFKPNLGPYPVGGSFHTVSPYSYPIGKNYQANHGASERHIFSTADWDESKTVIPTGTSGIPASPYYGNQTDLYLNFKYHDDPFSREAVEKHRKYKAVFH